MYKALPLLALCAFSVVAQTTLSITTNSLPPGMQYQPYSATLTASGGLPPYTWSINRAASIPRLDGLVLDPSTGQVSGTPTKPVCCAVFTVTDASGAQATKSPDFFINPSLRVGQPYPADDADYAAAPLTPPATCDVLSGALPPGVTWNATPDGKFCEFGGTPTAAGTFSATVNSGRPLNQIGPTTLIVQLGAADPPPGIVGAAYDQTIAPLGGTPPYQFSITTGSLPAGLSLDASTGRITGTPSKYEYQPFQLKITDGVQNSGVIPMGINIDLPVLQSSDFTVNVPANAAPGQTVPVSVTLNKPFPVGLTSALAAKFYPDPTMNVDDPNVALSQQPIAVFQLSPNATGGPAGLTLNTGTTAGDIVIAGLACAGFCREMTPKQAPYRVIHIGKVAPVIQNLTATAGAAGVTLTITGFSPSRDLTQATITLTPAPGVTLASNTVTVPLTSSASAWYSNSQSLQYGTQFGLSIPITLADGAKDVTSVSVTLANSSGTSAPVTATVTQ